MSCREGDLFPQANSPTSKTSARAFARITVTVTQMDPGGEPIVLVTAALTSQ